LLIDFDTLRVSVLVVMTAGLVTGQFLIYGWIKEALNAPPGVEIHKEEK
jgi:solute carrier family 25 phosphate transporter 3